MGWLVALGVLTLLAVLPIGVSAFYNSDGPLVRVIIGPVRIQLFPLKKKEKKEKVEKEKEETKKKAAASQTKQPEKKNGGSVKDFLPLVQVALDLLNDFRRKLRVNRLEMKLILAGDDPCDLAVNYGRAWTALGNLMPQLERFLVIKKRDLEVECDFTSDQTLIFARLDLTISLGRILALAVCYGIRALQEYFKIMNQRKGGAKI